MFAYDSDKKPNDWDVYENLIDVNTMVELHGQFRAHSSGNIATSSDYDGIKVPVKPNTTYSFSSDTYYSNLAFYDSNFTYISGLPFNDGVVSTFTTPNNCYFITLAVYKGYTKLQLEKGDTKHSYVPYTANELIINSNVESLNAGGLSGHSFTLLDRKVSQKVAVSTDTQYTFSTKIKKDTTGSCYVKLYNSNEEYIIEVPVGENAFYKDYELKGLQPKNNYYIIEFYGSADSGATFTDNMLAIGNYKSPWQQANGEVMNTQVNVNLEGVLVKSSIYLGDYTVMSPLEFAGYSNINGTITKVFSLNKDVTLVKKLEAEDEVKMIPIKIVPITTGDLQGWAFVPSTKEV